jgi:hypothetical protein
MIGMIRINIKNIFFSNFLHLIHYLKNIYFIIMKDFDTFLHKFQEEMNKLKTISEFKKEKELYTIWKSLDKSIKDKEIMEGPRILYNKLIVVRNIAQFCFNLIKKYIRTQEKQILKTINNKNSNAK